MGGIMVLLEKIHKIANLVYETAAELNQRETDVLEWVKAEIKRREREVLVGMGSWTDDDEKEWRKSTEGKSVPGNAI
jgi:hypothetical protein